MGCSVFGGINVNPNIRDQGPSCSSENYYVSQHNLAHHWRRPHMVPHSLGFPQLLTRTLPWVRDCMAERLPGHWPFETPNKQLKNRNLLEVLEDPTDSSASLWCVSEFSTRQRLLGFRLEHIINEGVDEWRIINDKDDDQTIDFSEGTGITAENCGPFADSEIFGNQLSYNPRFCHTLDVSNALLELLSYKPVGERHRILARGEKELYLFDPENDAVSTLFHRPVHSLSFIPYMNDEIVFLDESGLIWYGVMGENFVQAKCRDNIEVCFFSNFSKDFIFRV